MDILYLIIGIGWIFWSVDNLSNDQENIRKKSVLNKFVGYKSKISFFKAVNWVLLVCGVLLVLFPLTDFILYGY